MTALQKLILDALDQLGTMTEHELQTACFIGADQRGGFRHSLNRLFVNKWVRMIGASGIGISPDGVWAVEAHNIAARRAARRHQHPSDWRSHECRHHRLNRKAFSAY